MPENPQWRWRISRIGGNRAKPIGVVVAPDAKAAIEVAIKQHKIVNPDEQRRIAARPHDR